MKTGGCLCGGVQFTITGPMRPAIGCHCQQCQKTSGHYWAATSVADADLNLDRDEGLRWYHSSNTARRGFCAKCGSSLFWRPEGQSRMAIAVGALDTPTDLSLSAHVFVADKGDYYDIADGLPQYDEFSGAEDA